MTRIIVERWKRGKRIERCMMSTGGKGRHEREHGGWRCGLCGVQLCPCTGEYHNAGCSLAIVACREVNARSWPAIT